MIKSEEIKNLKLSIEEYLNDYVGTHLFSGSIFGSIKDNCIIHI